MSAEHFTDKDFGQKVLESDKPVLIDFYADWCGPCKLAAPIVEELAETYKDRVVVGKLDVDENGETAMKYGVMSIPTVIVFKDGKEVERKVGYGGKGLYEDLIKKVI